MADRTTITDEANAVRINDPMDAQVEELFSRARKAAIPAAIVAVVILGVAFSVANRREAIRKTNAAAYEALYAAEALDPAMEQDPAKSAENRKKQREVYENVIRDHAGTVAAQDARVKLAALELASGEFAKASEAYAAVATDLAAEPNRADVARLGQANALVGLEKFTDAQKIFQDIAARKGSPLAAAAAYQAAVVAYRQGDLTTAKAQLEAVVAADDAESIKPMATQFLNRIEQFDADTVRASFIPPAPKVEETKTPETKQPVEPPAPAGN